MKILRLGLLVLIAIGFVSCESFWTPMEVLLEHENPVVTVPAMVGSGIGGVAGVPLAVVGLPVTMSIAAAVNEPLVPLSPVFAMAEVGAVLVGGPFWLAAGWW